MHELMILKLLNSCIPNSTILENVYYFCNWNTFELQSFKRIEIVTLDYSKKLKQSLSN